jgi:hypothetical protein
MKTHATKRGHELEDERFEFAGGTFGGAIEKKNAQPPTLSFPNDLFPEFVGDIEVIAGDYSPIAPR